MSMKTYSFQILNANDQNINELRNALLEKGIFVYVSKGLLEITIDTEWEERIKIKNPRRAGRKGKIIFSDEKMINQSPYGAYETQKPYRYSDIIYLQQTMKDKDIITKIKIAPATYYRKKKKMIASEYYQEIDFDKAHDIEYLNSIPGNRLF